MRLTEDEDAQLPLWALALKYALWGLTAVLVGGAVYYGIRILAA